MQVEALLQRSEPKARPRDKVRRHTPARLNQKIDQAMMKRVLRFANRPREEISARIAELDQEWDIERVMETSAGTLALSGVALSGIRSRKWLVLTAASLGMLLQHSLTRGSALLKALRALGIRTRREIDGERSALRMLRGDFDEMTQTGEGSHRAIEALRLSRS
jgi:hypothetical protein